MAYSWSKLEDLFEQSISLTPDELQKFLDKIEKEDPELKKVLEIMHQSALEEGDYFKALQNKMVKTIADNKKPKLEIGTVIGNFRISGKIGKGGMGEVYLGERIDEKLEQKVAVKLLSQAFSDESSQTFFIKEQQILANLKHPYIAQFYDAGILENDHPYFIMEYVEGLPIDRYCEENKLNFIQRIKLFRQVCEAIDYSHQNLILHQDLKPDNILVTKEGYVKLLDFGIARFITEKHKTREKVISGTPYYAAPEQLKGNMITTASDVYQLGILLFKILTRELPFEIKRDENFLTRVSDEPMLPPSVMSKKNRLARKIKGEMDAIIMKALCADPSERYQNVSELLLDIDRFEAHKPISAVRNTSTYRFKKFLRRNAITVFSISLVILALSTASIVSYQQFQEAEKARIIAEQTSTFLKDLFTSANPFKNAERDYKKFSVYEFMAEKKNALFEDASLPDEMRWEMLEIIYLTYKNLSIDEEAIEVGEEMLRLAEKTGYRLWVAEANFYIGKAYAMDYMFDKSAEYYQRVYNELGLLEKENPIMAASLLKEVALGVHLSGNYDSAEYMYKEALATFARNNALSDEEAVRTYGNYSQLLRSTGRLDEALNMASKAVEKREEVFAENDINLASNYGDRALIYMEMTDYENSKKDFEKALNITLQHLDSTNQTFEILAGNYAIMLTLKGDFEKAERINEFLYNFAIESYGKKSMFTVYAQIQYAENLLHRNKADQAYEMSSAAISTAHELLPEGHTLTGMLHSLKARIALELDLFEVAEEEAKSALDILEKALPEGHYRTELARLRMLVAQVYSGDELAPKALKENAKSFLKMNNIHHLYQLEVEKYLEYRMEV